MNKPRNNKEYLKQARNNWVVTDEYVGTATAEYFQNLDKVVAYKGKLITSLAKTDKRNIAIIIHRLDKHRIPVSPYP